VFKKYTIPFDLDDPRATLAHRDIILEKPFLKRLYTEWYQQFISVTRSVGKGIYLEIGSGGGFLKDVFPEVVTSDILDLSVVDKVFSAEEMPYKDDELGCIMMLNVFHHIPRPYLFLKEAERTLIKGGKIVMIEPANSALGRFIYKRFHHEPFDETGSREIKAGNPLSNSNQALPHIYFERDLELFTGDFPHLKINKITYHTPFMYVLSGGVSRSPMIPDFAYGLAKAAEWLFKPFSKQLGLFCTIEIEKI
jgi:SAM-dependent methyltransferase